MLFEILYSCWFGLAVVGFMLPLLSPPPRLVMKVARAHTTDVHFDDEESVGPQTMPSLVS
jgi:hypothetical protein